MPFYHKLGQLPQIKHTQFLKADGKSLYREELVSSKGFDGVYSNKYHYNFPTAVKSAKPLNGINSDVAWDDAPVIFYHFYTHDKKKSGNFITSRVAFLKNRHCIMSTANITEDTEDFFRNAFHNEYFYIHHGTGKLTSDYGTLKFVEGDQIIVPRCTTYQLKFDNYKNNRVLIVESDTAFEIPKHYKNDYGQLLEHAPYAERDIKVPDSLDAIDKKGDFRLVFKAGDKYFEHILPHHPYDVVGWDGYLYPFSLNIKSYHPKVGRIHLPPPTHLCFKTQHFVLCNFVPRPFDFHDKAIPVPYFHSNIDSDEVIYYVDGDFMSRKGVKEGSITLHPGGMPHGPQPGKTEESLGKKETNEWAVMVDTYEPLHPTLNVKDTLDPGYPQSWLN
ncbi:MAG TPA: homogentisate 1,2-dioxygenase [candidate division Zixibacteria bacterium]|nr:homogentisate 1,2-dioxygenase [candidate division Zixibacteria bacterium]